MSILRIVNVKARTVLKGLKQLNEVSQQFDASWLKPSFVWLATPALRSDTQKTIDSTCRPRSWPRPMIPVHTTWSLKREQLMQHKDEPLIHSHTAMRRFSQSAFQDISRLRFYHFKAVAHLGLIFDNLRNSFKQNAITAFQFWCSVIARGCTDAITPLSQFLNWMGFMKLRND